MRGMLCPSRRLGYPRSSPAVDYRDHEAGFNRWRSVSTPCHPIRFHKDTDRHMTMTVHYRETLSTKSTTSGEGRILDLSIEGCRIECAHRLPVNTYLSLRLLISPKELPILVDLAAVRWTHGTACGIHFLSLQPSHTARLRTFLASATPQKQPSTPDQS